MARTSGGVGLTRRAYAKYGGAALGGGLLAGCTGGANSVSDLGVRDALASSDVEDFHGSRAAIDLETLLEVGPEVLLLRGYESKSGDEFRRTVVDFLRAHDTAGELTAVANDDVYRAGSLYQGPITNLFQLEMGAKQLYPDRFGAWPRYEGGDYPPIPADERLFDRQRVADIVTGGVTD